MEFTSLTVESIIENFSKVKDWLQAIFDKLGCQGKQNKQLFIAVDEIFTNISKYAYTNNENGKGIVSLKAMFDNNNNILKIVFKDNGIEYNPLYKEDPDIPKHIEQRTIGGLGIFMAKKMVDSIDYVREDDKNTLTLNKKMILS